MFENTLKRFGYEKRDYEVSYTAAIVSSILANAGASANAASTSALETCSGLVGRAFASAVVTGSRSEALTPFLMMMAGRSMIRKGEVLFLVRPGVNGAELIPVSTWSIEGGYDPQSWMYKLDLAGPTRLSSVNASWDDVVHVRLNADTERPWRGVGAVTSASLAAELNAKATGALVDEAGGPHGTLIPAPPAEHENMAAQMKEAKGSALLVESMVQNYQAGGTPPRKDWEQKRFGFDAPDSLLSAMEMSSDALMAAIGISAAIFKAKDAASAVASYRHFAHSVVGPLGRMFQMELQIKLDSPGLTMDFSDLRAADVNARANSFKKLVESGLDTEKALSLSGLMAASD